jgi:hypothetical protein
MGQLNLLYMNRCDARFDLFYLFLHLILDRAIETFRDQYAPIIQQALVGSISMKAAKPKIGVLRQEAEGRRKEPEEVFLQI